MWSLNKASKVLSMFIICSDFLGIFGQWVFEDDGCRTPDRGIGNCIAVTQCKPMLDVLQNLERPVSSVIQKQLQAYSCGTSGASVKVCCPPSPIILEPTRITQSRDGPPDVSSHANLYLLPKKCGYLNSDNRIVNGENAALNEFPWMALLRYRGKKGLRFNCGGTVINKNYILTAAHCITKLTNSELISVRVGEYNLNEEIDCERTKKTTKCNPPVQDVTIEEVIPHPRFSEKTLLHDIGLLRVSTMNLNVDNVQPVCLPLGKERTKSYDGVIVTGWGVINTNTGQTSAILQKVRLPVAEKASCANTYQNHNIKLTNAQICAGGVENKDSCPGDSGGPMLVPTIDEGANAIYVQQGIVSFGPKYCGIPGYPGVYTLVSYYMDWILDNLKP